MAEKKTQQNDNDVQAFLKSVENKKRKQDAFTMLDIMREIIGDEPKMWGTSIIGFGSSSYTTADGKTHDWFQTGFSPRKKSLSVYLNYGYVEQHPELMEKLGKYKTGKACLYINKLEDVDETILRDLIKESAKYDTSS